MHYAKGVGLLVERWRSLRAAGRAAPRRDNPWHPDRSWWPRTRSRGRGQPERVATRGRPGRLIQSVCGANPVPTRLGYRLGKRCFFFGRQSGRAALAALQSSKPSSRHRVGVLIVR
jgi:hypothetical protein